MRIAVRRGGGYGDVLLTTPVVKALKAKYPRSEITIVTDRYGYKILKGLPYIQHFMIRKGFHAIHHAPVDGFDLDYNLLYERQPDCHILDAYAAQAEVELEDKKPDLLLMESHHSAAQKWKQHYDIKDGELLIGIHRGPTWPCRSWHPLKFKAVAAYFQEVYRARVVEFSARAGFGDGWAIDLCGKTSIRQTAAILRHCSLLICIDSLLLHLAGAMDIPVVGIFGCTDPRFRLPFNEVSIGIQTEGSCRSCYHNGRYKTYCRCFRDRVYCMEEVGVQEVIQAAEILLYKTRE